MPRNQYTIVKRSTWYLLRTLLLAALIVVLCLAAFVTAMHASNIYILVTEGLELRADCILKGGDTSELTEYFTEQFVAKDAALYANEYGNFTVSNFIYKLEIKNLVVMPWDRNSSVRVYEKMLSISGTANEDAPEGAVLPAWTPAIYTVKLKKAEGRWYISDMILVQENPTEKPLPTPDYSQAEQPAE